MKKNKDVKSVRDFNFKYHIVGRIWMLFAILLFLMVPVAIGLHYGVTPDWRVFGSAAVIIPLIINFLSGVVEPIIYAPMLGTNSEYLAFMTGNLSNLKIPCVVKAQEICGTKLGSEENEVISTLAVATSTLVTTVIVAIFVLCLGVSNLSEAISKNSWIMPAFTCVVYAMFGSLGGKYVAKNPKLSLIPAAIVVVLSIILGVTGVGKGVGSAYLFVGIAVCALFALFRGLLEKRKQAAKAEQARLAAIDDEHVSNASQDALDAAASDNISDGSNAATADEGASEEAPENDIACDSDGQNVAPSNEASADKSPEE